MPTVAMSNGIKIEFYFDEHPPPHFHARYAEFVAQIDIEEMEIRNGSLPRPQIADGSGMGLAPAGGPARGLGRLPAGGNPGRIE
jgi:hypothetical protein